MLISNAAVRGIVDEFSRRTGPKTGLVVGASWGHPVLTAALETLMGSDQLTVVVNADDEHATKEGIVSEWPWAAGDDGVLAGNVSVVTSLADAPASDFVMLAAPVTSEAEEFLKDLELLREKVSTGGILTLAATLTAPAREEIAELVSEYGVGSDLVVRSWPPLKIHRLRMSTAKPVTAEQVAPAWRPSSVPLTRKMHIDSNGIIAAGLCLGTAALVKKVRPNSKAWMLPAAAALPVATFFRDPVRDADYWPTDDDPTAVLSACDGKVLGVEHIIDERFGAATGAAGEEWLRISVFLSVTDVHVNRSPVAGQVVDVFREKGGYAPAMKPDAEHNVACYTVLDTARGRVAVAQRTGLVARRIVNRTKVGATLAKGERYGLIRFGSRTDIYLPAGAAEALVAPGEVVRGGETVLARWNS